MNKSALISSIAAFAFFKVFRCSTAFGILMLASTLSLKTPAQSAWTNHYPFFYDIAASPTTYVVAGDMPMVSEDLVNWQSTSGVRSNAWTGIVFAQNRFISVSQRGELAFSYNGRDWTYHSLKPLLPDPADDVRYQGIRYLNEQYFVLARGILSSSDASDWSVHAKAQDYESYRDITYGNGLLVAVGLRGTIAVSPDGENWRNFRPFGDRNLRTVAFFKDKFYIINVLDSLFVSSNAETWTETGKLPAVTLLVHEDRIYASGSNGIYKSSDGESWELIQTSSKFGSAKLRILNGRFFACGVPAVLMESEDGANWNSLLTEGETTDRFAAVAAFSTNRLALGRQGELLHSTAGGDWDKVTLPTSSQLYSLASFQDQFVAGGSQGRIFTSPDGLQWTLRESHTIESVATLSVANGHIFASGFRLFLSSANAIDWVVETPPTNLLVYSVMHGANLYVAAGSRTGEGGGTGISAMAADELPFEERVPAILVSNDLTEWTPVMGDYGDFFGGAYGNGIFLLAGTKVAISSDGLNWTNVDPGIDAYFEHTVFANGKFYLSGLIGSLMVTSDGLNWTSVPCSTHGRLYAIAATPNSLLAVGEIGAIVEAPFDLYFGKSRRTARGYRQSLYGASGPLTIQSSSDLRDWNTFLELTDPPNPMEFFPGNTSALFFRAFQQITP